MSAPTWDGVIVRVKSPVTDCVGDVDDEGDPVDERDTVGVSDVVSVPVRDGVVVSEELDVCRCDGVAV